MAKNARHFFLRETKEEVVFGKIRRLYEAKIQAQYEMDEEKHATLTR